MTQPPQNGRPAVLIVCSAVGPLGSPVTGGVLRFAVNVARALIDLGFSVTVIHPAAEPLPSLPALGFAPAVRALPVEGALQPTAAQGSVGEMWPAVQGGVLAAMMQRAFEVQGEFDLILNLNHDWLPFYLTPFFATPLVHVANLCQSDAATDQQVTVLGRAGSRRVAFVSRFQAELFDCGEAVVLPAGLDPDKYPLGDGAAYDIAWAGRIVPAKGLERALMLAKSSGAVLHIAGHVEDANYWAPLASEYAGSYVYHGHLGTAELADLIGSSRIFLQTQNWLEALGIVTIESMLCGTPVVALARGANTEIVVEGVGGYLLAPDCGEEAFAAAAAAAARLDRGRCREAAIERHAFPALRAALASWCATRLGEHSKLITT